MRTGRVLVTALLVLAAAGLGWWARTWMPPAASGPSAGGHGDGPCPDGSEPLYWRGPMDPSYVRDRPGKSPMGMDLIPVCPGEETRAPGVVAVDSSMVQSIGVRTAPVERRDLARTLRTVGRVDYDERLVEHVHTKVQGWIEQLYVEYEGQEVRRGQPLVEIYSPELVSTQEELVIASRYRQETAASSFPEVREAGESLFEATRRRLELWDVPERFIERLLETGDVQKTLTLDAPSDGVVTHQMVREGMEVGPNQNLYTIADLSRVWIYADIYEYELPWVQVGQRATVNLSYLPGTTFEGEVTYVYPFLDPKTRTARVRIELPNPEGVLKPNMFADVRLQTETQAQVLVIPEEAVIRSGTRNLAIAALGQGRFEPRTLELGLDSGDGWLEVRGGLAEGERIVTSAQFLIDSESKLQEAVQKVLGANPEDSGSHEQHTAPELPADHETPSAPPSEAREP